MAVHRGDVHRGDVDRVDVHRVDVDRVEWDRVLAHREPEDRREVAARFERSGVTPACVARALADGGDELYAAAQRDEAGWAEPFGGHVAAALLAAEVGALAAHLNSRSSAVRAVAVDALLDQVSAVSVAARLGVSRQKVYTIARGALERSFIDQVPWRRT